MHKKVLLVIIDGWGFDEMENDDDAIKKAKPKNMTYLSKKYPSFLLRTMGEYVGHRKGHVGDSFSGHRTIGIGRSVESNLTRLNKVVYSDKLGKYFKGLNKTKHDKCHIVGLATDLGGIAHIDYLIAIMKSIKIKKLYMHIILDGIYCDDNKGSKFLNEIIRVQRNEERGIIASVLGRNYVYTDNKDSKKLDIAYKTITTGSPCGNNARLIMEQSYVVGINDPDMLPVLVDEDGLILPKEPIVFSDVKIGDQYEFIRKFHRDNPCYNLFYYNNKVNIKPVFSKTKITNTLPDIISKSNLRQGYVYEKSRHEQITTCFHGGKEKCVRNEILICVNEKETNDERNAYTYQILEQVVKLMKNGYDFIVCTLTAIDIAARYGDFDDICKAILEIDRAIGDLFEMCRIHNFTLIIVSEYGNVEHTFDEDDEVFDGNNTKNNTPFIICDGENTLSDYARGKLWSLKDVAPTILSYIGLDIPIQMTGKNLIIDYKNKKYLNNTTDFEGLKWQEQEQNIKE